MFKFKVGKEDIKLSIEDVLNRYEKDYNLSFEFGKDGYVESVWVGSKKIEPNLDK